jgi:spermidine/putrescine transport system ATP-binding protein
MMVATMDDPTTPAISLQNVTKRFGSVTAVDAVWLDIREGEFITLLGPSGCGKTTTMRLIAGFEEPDEGRILLRGHDVVGSPPNKREVNMCFQHYALFPHMTVEENIAYSLRLRKVPKEQRHTEVGRMLEIVRLDGYEDRRPGQLSGGQQQRVALARALINLPAALLLDEPLGALDVKLRKQMELELKRIQLELGTTFVYVTHDQEEALSMSDRIAVMNAGVIEQLGTPHDVYDHPDTPFVADFVGMLNAVDFRVDANEGEDAVMRIDDRERIVVPAGGVGAGTGATLLVAVRPERIGLAPGEVDGAAASSASRLTGKVAQVVYLGTLTQFHVDTRIGKRFVVHRLSDEGTAGVAEGDTVTLTWARDDASVLRGNI